MLRYFNWLRQLIAPGLKLWGISRSSGYDELILLQERSWPR
jgi:hypothetical protein